MHISYLLSCKATIVVSCRGEHAQPNGPGRVDQLKRALLHYTYNYIKTTTTSYSYTKTLRNTWNTSETKTKTTQRKKFTTLKQLPYILLLTASTQQQPYPMAHVHTFHGGMPLETPTRVKSRSLSEWNWT